MDCDIVDALKVDTALPVIASHAAAMEDAAVDSEVGVRMLVVVGGARSVEGGAVSCFEDAASEGDVMPAIRTAPPSWYWYISMVMWRADATRDVGASV